MIHFDFIEKKIYTIENNHSRNETEVACFFVHVFFSSFDNLIQVLLLYTFFVNLHIRFIKKKERERRSWSNS